VDKKPEQHAESPHSLVIIEDEKIVASMLVAMLSSQSDFKVLGNAFSGAEGLALCRKTLPDIVLLDIALPDMSGFDVALMLKEAGVTARVVILSSHVEPYFIYQAVRLGLHGFVDKQSSLENLTSAIRQVGQGKRYFSAIFNAVRTEQLAQPDSFHKILTPRELAILMMVTTGMDDAAIGLHLGITPSTVSTHRRNLRLKLKAHSDRDLLAYAREWGLVPLNSSPST
jgi:DNA-binding NarL/FixJ family response regulator